MRALLALLALIPLTWGQVEVRHFDGLVGFTDLYGNARFESAAMMCLPSHPVLLLSPRVGLETLAHELAHAYDCMDDGLMNASPIGGWRPAERPAWATDYCWDTDAEWYACLVTR